MSLPVVLFLLLVAEGTATPASGASELVCNAGDYMIENWQVEQGLPQVSVTSIAQTLDGYLWLGTFNGLVRFDGVRFTVFNEANTPPLGSSGITQLDLDEEGGLWIVTVTGGLVRMAAGRFTALSREAALVPSGVLYLLHDPTQRLLLLDSQGELHRIENGQVWPLARLDALRTNDEPRLLIGNGGVTWLVQRGKTTHHFQTTVQVPGDDKKQSEPTDLTIDCAVASQFGGYWLATSQGVYRVQPDQVSARLLAPLPPLPPGVEGLFSMKEDGQGNLWAARWGAGVYRLDPAGTWQHFGGGTGLADKYVNCLFVDREGILWAGTGQGGLHRFRPRVFQMHHTEGGSGSDVVTSVTQDRQGRMWFGVNGGGLHERANGGLKRVLEPAFLRPYALVYSVLADRQDALWIGLYGEQALRWQAGTLTPHNLGDGTAKEITPPALFEDHAGIIWLGCSSGLLRYERGRLTRYTTRDGLSAANVVALAEDRDGSLYVGTDGGGLNCLRLGRFTAYTARDGLADDHVSSLHVDKEDTLWIGTGNGGLSRFRKGRFVTFTAKDGLPSNTVGSLQEDDLGNLWLGSNRGIIRVDRQALNNYADGQRHRLAWQVFGLSDGLSTIGCLGNGQPASWKAHDGKLWFATIKGVAVVDPNHLTLNPLPPPVVIEEIVMDDRVYDLQRADPNTGASKLTGTETAGATNRAINGASSSQKANQAAAALSWLSGIRVPPRTHRLEFHFTGLSLTAPNKVQFRYRLDPFDRDWVEAGSRRVAYYTGVPPGSYQLRVTACNNDGVWNQAGASLGLVVLPSWWMTWWFRSLTVVGVMGLLFGGYLKRTRRLERERLAQEGFSRRLIASQEKERQRIAGELHDGMGQDLLVIASQAQLSLRQEENPPATAARLKEIAETAKHALQQARLMAHNLRPGLLDELGFTKAVRATVEKAAQASGLSMAIKLADVNGLLPPEFEANLFRVIQETLNNILKHAKASEAKITLTREPASLRLVVEDNGCGFEPRRLESGPPDRIGFGLRQIAERAKMMGGRIHLQSRPGHGTRLTVEVPLKEAGSWS